VNLTKLQDDKTSPMKAWLLQPNVSNGEPIAWATGKDYEEHVYNFYKDGSCVLVIPIDLVASQVYGDSHLSIYFPKLKWSPELHSDRYNRIAKEWGYHP